MKIRSLVIVLTVAFISPMMFFSDSTDSAVDDTPDVFSLKTYEGEKYTYETHSSDGKYWSHIIGYEGVGESIMIQSSMEGYPMTRICENAFGDSAMKVAIVPHTVTYIGDRAFFGCGSLERLYFLGTMPECGADALGGATVFYLSLYAESWDSYGGTKIEIPQTVAGGVVYYVIENEAYAGGWDSGTDIIVQSSVSLGSIYNVRSILPWAFYNNENLTALTISEGITVVEERAFMYCEKLKILSLPSSLKVIDAEAFRMDIPESKHDSRSSLTSLVLPSGLEYMGFECFRMSCELKSVKIPDSVTTYCEGAFRACYKMESIVLGTGITEIPEWSFDNSYALRTVIAKGNITSIGNCAFLGDSSLESVSLGNPGPSVIGFGAFSDCNSLKSAPVSNAQHIGDKAFSGCGSLGLVDAGSAKSIGNNTFYNSGITKILIGAVDSIGERAFTNCLSLVAIEVRGSSAYNSVGGVLFCSDTLMCYPADRPGLSYDVPTGTVSVAEAAFIECKLRSVSTPDTLRSIGDRAFFGSDLEEITIAPGLSSVGNYVFGECKELKSAYFMGVPPVFGSSAFSGTPDDFRIYYDKEHAEEWGGIGNAVLRTDADNTPKVSLAVVFVVINSVAVCVTVIISRKL